MTIQAGAEPFSAQGGPVGVLLCHGFTGSPASLRPWALALAESGLTVDLPLLPGHGTRWQDLQLTRWTDWYAVAEQRLLRLRANCDEVVVAGLSMGGALALRLAEEHQAAVAGLAIVNPSIHSRNKMLPLLPMARHVIAAFPGIVNDIKCEGQDEIGYDRMPLQAMSSLTNLWKVVTADLSRVTQPLLVFASEVDHVVEPSNAQAVMSGVSSKDRELVRLPNSYHVATLDNDAPKIFSNSLEFIHRITNVDAGEAADAGKA